MKAQSDIALSGKSLSMTAPGQTITTMVIAGAEGGVCTPDAIIPYVKVHDGGWNETTDVAVNKGDSLVIGPHPWEGGRWVWSGPKDFKSTDRASKFKNMDGTMSGYYKAVYTNASGCENSVTIKVVVDDPAHPFVEPDTTENDSIKTSIVVRGFDNAVQELPRNVQVFDLQGRFLKKVQKFDPKSFRAGVYLVKQSGVMYRVRVH